MVDGCMTFVCVRVVIYVASSSLYRLPISKKMEQIKITVKRSVPVRLRAGVKR